jgi:hypothetical protein
MVPNWFFTVITIGVAVMALAMIVQLGLMAGTYFAVRTLQRKTTDLMDHQIQPILSKANVLSHRLQDQVERLSTSVNLIAERTEQRADQLDRALAESIEKARLQVVRADSMVSRSLDGVEHTASRIGNGVSWPFRRLRDLAQRVGRAMGRRRAAQTCPTGIAVVVTDIETDRRRAA